MRPALRNIIRPCFVVLQTQLQEITMKHAAFLSAPALTAVVLMGAGHAVAQSTEQVERPEFKVVKTGDAAELRRYEPTIVAEVVVDAASEQAASSKGFRPLANYIFGKNEPGRKIDMTAPVTTAPVDEAQDVTGGDGEKIAMTAPVTTMPDGGEGSYRVQFTMPSKWTMDTLPAPENDAVRIRSVPEQFVVASGFTGPRTDSAVQSAESAVSAFIEKNDLTASGPFAVAGYSGPDVPRENREWEVHRMVEAPE
jgi:hypothetical protein